MRLADYVIENLIKNKITNTFCVTGRGSLFLTDALAKNKYMKTTFMHHEQSAAIATISASQLSGKPNCCIISTGCASFNTLTGLLSAWQDNIPSIFISGQNFLKQTTNYTKSKIKTFGEQEADIVLAVKSITKYSTMLISPDNVKYIFEKAMSLLNEHPKGPVWIDIPLDIQNSQINPEKLKSYNKNYGVQKSQKKNVNFIIKNIKESKRPVILVGSGIKLANAVNEFRYLVKKLQIPVIFTSSAPDIYGSKNRISIGSAGSQGCTRAGNFVLQNSDLLIVLGCRLNSAVIGSDIKKFARRAKIILVNNNKNESIKIKKTIEIISDLKIFINSLNKKFFFPKKTKWLKKCIYWKKIFYNYEDLDNCKKKIGLYKFSEILSEIMPARSIFICDSGFVDVIMPTNIKFNNTQSCLHPVSQGMMGYAIPSIVGANQVKKRPIVCVVGDGSIMMNIQELQTISFNKIPAKIFVINNNLYGIIRRRQKNLFRERTIGTDPSNGLNAPNFKDVAKCFGFRYQKISSNKYAKEKIKKILELKSPILCEVLGSENQNYIEVSHAKNKFGKFVRRPLEDQSPFLDRNLFLKEMIIEPIDL